jgi:hypothetical protein
VLHGDVYVRGIAVSGHLQQRRLDLPPFGRIRVSGGRRGSGTLTLDRKGTVTGTIGGKRVKVHAATAAAARARGALSVQQLVARLPRRHPIVRTG